jgi:hypothetical protein
MGETVSNMTYGENRQQRKTPKGHVVEEHVHPGFNSHNSRRRTQKLLEQNPITQSV